MAEETIKSLREETFKKDIEKGVTLVDFYADWCGPCRMMAPILEKIATEVKGKAIVAKLDIEKAQTTASHFQISSIPTLILFKDGKEVGRLIGYRSGDEIKAFIKQAG